MEISQAYKKLAGGRLTPMWLAAAESQGSYQGQCQALIIIFITRKLSNLYKRKKYLYYIVSLIKKKRKNRLTIIII